MCVKLVFISFYTVFTMLTSFLILWKKVFFFLVDGPTTKKRTFLRLPLEFESLVNILNQIFILDEILLKL